MNLSDLAGLGITARLDDAGALVLDAPAGVLRGDLLDRLRAAKPVLVAEIMGFGELGELGEHCSSMFTLGGKGMTPTAHLHTGATRWRVTLPNRQPMTVHCVPPATLADMHALYPDATALEPQDSPPAAPVPTCDTCASFRRPGLSDGYCGGGARPDLPKAYGLHHPLRRLPPDGGTGCPAWANSKVLVRVGAIAARRAAPARTLSDIDRPSVTRGIRWDLPGLKEL